MLNFRTVAKILRENFTGETPIIKTASEQKGFISSLKTELKQIKGVNISFYKAFRDDEPDRLCHVSIRPESSRSYEQDSFTIKFNQQDELLVEHYRDSFAIVYQVEQIYSFVERLKSEYEKKQARRLKTKKINKLKQQAIIAKIKEIAKKDQFDFHILEYERKLKLSVRIEDGRIVEVDIPYSQFQEILKELRSLIQTLRELQQLGITFKLKYESKYRSFGWITHDSL
jgi:transcription antitermination factor NusG